MDQCPACGGPRLYPSRARSIRERLRRLVTSKRPFRCHACGWRAWIDVPPPARQADTTPDDLRTGRAARPVGPGELDGLEP
jgi:hypothetical protein